MGLGRHVHLLSCVTVPDALHGMPRGDHRLAGQPKAIEVKRAGYHQGMPHGGLEWARAKHIQVSPYWHAMGRTPAA